MKRAVIQLAEWVYEFANPLVDPSWFSYPWYLIALCAGKVLDVLDPIPSVADRGKPS